VPPTSTPLPPEPTAPPPPTSTPAPAAPAAGPADFSGRWRITDTVTEGSNVGDTFTFDVTLTQNGNQLSGGNNGIQMSGTVSGDTALVQYAQPALGYTGTFIWTMVAPGEATGSFTSSYPNSGTSTLHRLQ
jgi:hypothetical protein